MSRAIRTVLHVEGMTCSSCVKHVGAALRGVAGVSQAEVDLANARATVDHDPDVATVDALAAAVEREGYTARPA